MLGINNVSSFLNNIYDKTNGFSLNKAKNASNLREALSLAKEDLQDLRKNPSIINSYESNSSKDYIYTDLNQYFNINENDDSSQTNIYMKKAISQTNDGAVMTFFDPSDEYYSDDIANILIDKIAQKDGFLKEQNLDELREKIKFTIDSILQAKGYEKNINLDVNTTQILQNLDEYGLSNLILEDFKYDSKFQEQINFLKDEFNRIKDFDPKEADGEKLQKRMQKDLDLTDAFNYLKYYDNHRFKAKDIRAEKTLVFEKISTTNDKIKQLQTQSISLTDNHSIFNQNRLKPYQIYDLSVKNETKFQVNA